MINSHSLLKRGKKLSAASSELSFVCVVLVLSLKMFLGLCVLFENFLSGSYDKQSQIPK